MNSFSGDTPEPIAIVGIGCRFPGASNPSEFWDLLCSGRDAIREVPEDRWNIDRFYSADPNAPGKTYMRKGGFLQQKLDEFDAAFFGISPREAVFMDPQQRLLLEVAWEAMEDAGTIPTDLAGTDVGVFVGGFTLDAELMQLSPLNRETISTHSAAGASMTMLSNRLSYCLDFRGPSISVDTACSSSLVATHLACQGIWRGECSVALAGGVNAMFRPEYPTLMSKGQFLAPDGYCKSFDARANGYSRGEGAGIVVLKPYQGALRDGDEIYALIRGTGVNQDGHSDGITVPNPASQESLIKKVYSAANIPVNKVRYVEAHGTGTAVGDPIEASVLGKTIGVGRTNGDACVIGSTKAAIGHLEAAAGVAGLIKASLCAYHGEIPPQANLRTPNPDIPFEQLGLRLPRERQPMPYGEGPVYVGVNSFGYGGTNAHVVLEQLPLPPDLASFPQKEVVNRPYVLPLSARDPNALKALARSYADLLSQSDAPELRDICNSAINRRAHHDYRLALVADSSKNMIAELLSFAEQGRSERSFSGKTPSRPQDKPVFVLTGMGPQWWAMGRELLESEPVFRQAAEAVDEAFHAVAGWSILAEMHADKEQSNIKQTRIAQPANFLIQVALSELLRSWGVQPAAIVGHSVGEVSAAYVSGALDLKDAVRVSYHRSRLQQTVAGAGQMLATGLGLQDARAFLAGREQLVSVGAINSPGAVTLSGDADALKEIAAELEEKGVFNRFLQVEVPYHSPHMEPLKAEMREVLRDLRPRAPSTPLYSTVTGCLVEGVTHDAEYWCNNMREPVLFGEAVSNILERGHLGFLEVGPHPVLATSIKEAQRNHDAKGEVFASLRREEPEQATVLMTLAGLYVSGYHVDWQALVGKQARNVKLPTYPWQRETFWCETQTSIADRLGRPDHPLLGMRVPAPAPTWDGELVFDHLAYINDHVIDGATVFPGAAYIEQGLAIQSLLEENEGGILEDLEFRQALLIGTGENPILRSTFDKDTREYRVYSRRDGESSDWTFHAQGRILPAAPFVAQSVSLKELQSRCQESIDAGDLYAKLSEFGLNYGPWFQRIQRLWRGSNEALVELEAHESQDGALEGYFLHPTLLDASLQSLIATLHGDDENGRPYVPVSIRRVSLHSKLSGHCWSHVRLTKQEEDGIEGDIVLCNDKGAVIAELIGVRCQPVASSKSDRGDYIKDHSYVPTWQKTERQEVSAESGRWLVFTDQSNLGVELANSLKAGGATVVEAVSSQDILRTAGDPTAPMSEKDWERLDIVLRGALDCVGIVYLAALDNAACAKDWDRGNGTVGLLRLVQGLARSTNTQAPRLYVVTRGAQHLEGELVSGLMQAPVIGLARTTMSEHPDLRCTLIDLDSENGLGDVGELSQELLCNSSETEVALRGSDRYVSRLLPLSQHEGSGEAGEEEELTAADASAFLLEVGTAGRLESLRFREIRRRSPGPGEVEMQISAAALNFKDLMKVLGRLPARALEGTFNGASLGMEAAGVITSVGEGITDYHVGDEVVACVKDAFSSHVTVRADAVPIVHKPKGMRSTDAASVLVIFMTAFYALNYLARLRKGETVLIHAAAGGVGLAAIQVAQWLGAEIIATAGSDEKRGYIRSLGVEHVLNSRTLEFADQVMEITNGRGVDVVLNSLSGEALVKTLSTVASFGRFVEVGKRDIIENTKMPMLPFNRNLSFMSVDLDRMAVERPELIQSLLNEVWERFSTEDFVATRVEKFAAAEISEAFRLMAQSKHIGKIVISFEDLEGVSVIPLKEKLFKDDASYLITGGFGGFGLQVAKWMAQEGARHLALVGRSGAKTAEAQQAVHELEEQGVAVKAFAADIGEEGQVADLFAEMGRTMPPLRGVMHAAAVLDDALIVNLDETRLQRVMAPKARGAWLLHKSAKDLPLDFFVLFSSVSSIVGNPGQGNYVAANAFLDALAHYRRAKGLPATSINWGAIGEVGMLANSKETAEHLDRVGIRAIRPKDAMAALAAALKKDTTELGFMDVDWSKWRQVYAAAASSPKFAHVLDQDTSGQNAATEQIRAMLLGTDAKDRPEMLALIIAELVAETMRLPSDRIDIHQPLTEMGIDSLMAVELQIGIHDSFGIEFPVLELVKGESIFALARELLTRMGVPIGEDEQQNENASKASPQFVMAAE